MTKDEAHDLVDLVIDVMTRECTDMSIISYVEMNTPDDEVLDDTAIKPVPWRDGMNVTTRGCSVRPWNGIDG